MAETSFIKTVVFGGYDKSETDNLFEALNLQICDLQNELRQTKLLLENYKSDSDESKSFETVLAAERAKLSKMQVQNDNLNAKNKELTSTLRSKELEIKKLSNNLYNMKNELAAAKEQLSDHSDEAAAKMFTDAQKASDQLMEDARAEAEALRQDSMRLAENVISQANDNAEKIIRKAEKKAEDITERAVISSSLSPESFVALKHALLNEIQLLGDEFDKIREFIDDFAESGNEWLDESEKVLTQSVERVNAIKFRGDAGSKKKAANDDADIQSNKADNGKKVSKTSAAGSKKTADVKENKEEHQEDLDMLMAMAEALNDE